PGPVKAYVCCFCSILFQFNRTVLMANAFAYLPVPLCQFALGQRTVNGCVVVGLSICQHVSSSYSIRANCAPLITVSVVQLVATVLIDAILMTLHLVSLVTFTCICRPQQLFIAQ